MQENGVHIPADAIKIDIGIFPAYVGPTESGDKECTTNAMISLLFNLNKKNRLVHKLGTEIVPIIELPRNRAQWKTPDGAIQRKFFKQCARICMKSMLTKTYDPSPKYQHEWFSEIHSRHRYNSTHLLHEFPVQQRHDDLMR